MMRDFLLFLLMLAHTLASPSYIALLKLRNAVAGLSQLLED
jgi:hypothetical protein